MTKKLSASESQRKPRQTLVYVVDDDVSLCESVTWLLDSIDIKPVICHSAAEFLEKFDDSSPACLILDVRMPQMSGPRLQEHLNEIAPHASIIFVSAHGDIRLSVNTMQAGAQDFLEKPYDSQQLLDAVQLGVERASEDFVRFEQTTQIARRIDALSPREKEVLRLAIEGLPSQNIARKLCTSVKTVDVHRARIKSKTKADSVGTLVRDILRFDLTV